MKEKKNLYEIIEEICAKDRRYKADAYEFLLQALNFVQKEYKITGHVTGGELSRGVREFSIQQYGPMAKTVLNHWGIFATIDIGNIVFNMIEFKLLSKTDSDSLNDFLDVYDFNSAFSNTFGDNVLKDAE
jgi:uncharacterized repeat protein (TIGR04138 family)